MSEAALSPALPRLSGPRVPLLAALGVALVGVGVASLGIGAIPIAVGDVVAVLLAAVGIGAAVDPLHETVVMSVRLPRMLTGAILGMGLGAAGALVQGWFRNPLADPGLIGVSAGATLAAAASIVGASLLPAAVPVGFVLPVAATLGGLVATLVVLRLGRVGGSLHVATVLLAGIAVNALCGALVGMLVTAADDVALRDLTFWTMGSVGGASWSRLVWMAPPIALALLLGLALIRPLDALLLGEPTARSLGVDTARLGPQVAGVSAVLVGVGVAACGQVGFVGLVAPHLIRLMAGPRHAVVVPGSALLGGLLVVGADTIARTVVAPVELPLGLVTALIGAPVFLHLLPRAVRGGA